MTPGPRRATRAAGRPHGRSRLLAATTALLALAWTAGTAAPALAAARPTPSATDPGASPTASATPAPPLSFAVDEILPRAPRPGDPLQVLGTLTNTGSSTLTDLQLRVRVGGRLATRGELRLADSATLAYGPPRATVDLPDLPAGSSTPLDLRVDVDDLRLGADGVYPLQVEGRGLTGRSGGRTPVGALTTYLPWFGSTTVDPLRVAWLWPLVDRPRRGPDDLLQDDGLATSLAPDGRLGRSLAGARQGETTTCPPAPAPATPAPAVPVDPTVPVDPAVPPVPVPGPVCSAVPVTYAVDPDLLADVRTMTQPYAVAGPAVGGAPPSPGQGTAAATAWLASLRSATASSDVLALPFADPDVVALARSSSGLAADVPAAQAYGTSVARDVLATDVLGTVAYPPAGRLSDAAFDLLTTGSTRSVVLEDDAVTPSAGSTRSTPGTRVALPPSSTAGDVTGLVVDRALSDLLVPSRAQDPRLAEQRFLVETAMVSAELPSRGRTLLVALPRRGTVDPAVVGPALSDTGRVPWMCPVRLADVAAASESCPGAATPSHRPERTTELAQPDPRSPALGATLLGEVGRLRQAATQLTGSIIAGGTEQAQATRTRLQRSWLRGESSAWRGDDRDGRRLVALAAADVTRLRDQVSVVTGPVTLTSNKGRVSVAVVNALDQPVTVAVRLQAPSSARLSQAQTDVLEVPASTSVTVPVEAQTLTSGRFVVRAQLLDRDGTPFGEPQDMVVRSTRYGTVALAVTGLGAAVLLLAAGVRLVRRALHRPVRT